MKKILISGIIGKKVKPIDVRAALDEAKGEAVEIEISSEGGSVFAGVEVFNLIKNYAGQTTTKITSLAASIASYIALASDRVEVEENAVYMIHNAHLLSVSGDHHELRKFADSIEGLSDILVDAYAKKSGKTRDQVRALMDEETFFYGEEIVKNGFADAVIGEFDNEYKAVAIDDARLKVAACLKLMDGPANLKFVGKKPQTNEQTNEQTQTGRAATKPEPVKDKMTLKEFLEKDAEAKAEYDKAIAEAKTDKEAQAKVDQLKVGAEYMEAKASLTNAETRAEVSKQAMAVLESTEYPQAVRAMAIKVLKNEVSEESLVSTMTTLDAIAEQTKSAQAQAEQPEPTPGQQPPASHLDKDGVATSPDGIAELAAKTKAQMSTNKPEVK